MTGRLTRWSASAAAALLADALLGDGPLRPHPVAVFGRAMTRLERTLWDDGRARGAAYAVAGVGGAAAAGALLDRLPGGAALAAYTAVAARGLWAAAGQVERALEAGDLDAARSLLPALVGRDPALLDAEGMARACVESVAENTVDAIVAPALYAALGGATGALAYRGTNTLDSMVGYRDGRYGRFGWASARLDDLANLVPARLTALLVAAVRPGSAVRVARAVARDAPAHPSPNAGVAEAAFAAALGLRLGGTTAYRHGVEERPLLGRPGAPRPVAADIGRAVECSQHVTLALAASLGAWAFARAVRP